MSYLGPILRDQRLKLGLTQSQLAERSGLGLATIQNLEANRANPEWGTLERLCGELGLKIEIKGSPSRWQDLLPFGVPLLGASVRAGSDRPGSISKRLLNQVLGRMSEDSLRLVRDERERKALASFFCALRDHFPSSFQLLNIDLQAYLRVHFLDESNAKLRRIALSHLSEIL